MEEYIGLDVSMKETAISMPSASGAANAHPTPQS